MTLRPAVSNRPRNRPGQRRFPADERRPPADLGPALIYLASLDQSIPGQCDDCDADARMVEYRPNLFALTISHDDTCPWLTGATR